VVRAEAVGRQVRPVVGDEAAVADVPAESDRQRGEQADRERGVGRPG